MTHCTGNFYLFICYLYGTRRQQIVQFNLVMCRHPTGVALILTGINWLCYAALHIVLYPAPLPRRGRHSVEFWVRDYTVHETCQVCPNLRSMTSLLIHWMSLQLYLLPLKRSNKYNHCNVHENQNYLAVSILSVSPYCDIRDVWK